MGRLVTKWTLNIGGLDMQNDSDHFESKCMNRTDSTLGLGCREIDVDS